MPGFANSHLCAIIKAMNKHLTIEYDDDSIEPFDDSNAVMSGVQCVPYPGVGFDGSAAALFPNADMIIGVDLLPAVQCTLNGNGFILMIPNQFSLERC